MKADTMLALVQWQPNGYNQGHRMHLVEPIPDGAGGERDSDKTMCNRLVRGMTYNNQLPAINAAVQGHSFEISARSLALYSICIQCRKAVIKKLQPPPQGQQDE